MKNIKLGSIIKVVGSFPTEEQDGIEKYIGREYKVLGHWKQKDTDLLKGEIRVSLDGKYEYILNNKEYVIVE